MHLGEPAESWQFETATPVQMAAYPQQPFSGALTLCSIGVSDLALAHDTGPLGQELTFGCLADQFDEEVLRAFQSMLSNIISNGHRAKLRQGEVVSLTGPLVAGRPYQDVLADLPQYFPEPFWSTVKPPSVAIVWLIPLHPAEAELARDRGYDQLTELLESTDPNLFDLDRPSIV